MSLRVFHRAPLRAGDVVTLDAEESHYLCRVRRAGPAAALEVLDGVASSFSAQVQTADPRAATVKLLAALTHVAPPPVEVAIGMPEGKTTLEALGRACELGAARAVLVTCERGCATAPKAGRIARVLAAAQRQCGRPDSLPVEGPVPLHAWLDRPSEAAGYVAWTKMRGRPTTVHAVGDAGARVLVGPEGGLTDAEVDRARARGLQSLSLGPWTLRTEVAVAAAITRLLHGHTMR